MRLDYFFDDIGNSVRHWLRLSDGLTPPRRLIDAIGGGDFASVGREYFGLLKDRAGLKPDSRMLEIGSGCGRIAVPLIPYLGDKGEYWGLEIMAHVVRWCEKRISPRHPNFHFQRANLYNKTYNPKGQVPAEKYTFPYPDAYFDVVLLASVFTHMMPEAVDHYFAEIRRVLKPGGRCLASFFLLNEQSEKLLQAGKGSIVFRHSQPPCRVEDPQRPERAVAYEEGFVRDRLRANGLSLQEPILYGHWCGRTEGFVSYQDLILAT